MQKHDRVHNFSAGPGALPLDVLEQIKEDLLNHANDGMSVMEMSHRGKPFLAIAERAQNAARKLLHIPDNYTILFLQGGASLQFTMLPQNLLAPDQTADYVITGAWGEKAHQFAKQEGNVNIVYSAKDSNYNHAPNLKDLTYSPNSAYVHITLNETIQGVDFHQDPNITQDVVCDMSSVIASRPIDISKYALIYAGAQKNLGPAGTTLLIIRNDILERSPKNLSPMLSYQEQAKNEWMLNTPPTWSIYVTTLVLEHWIKFGGLQKIATHNRQKADLILNTIKNSRSFYTPHAKPENQSHMNIPFTLPNEDLTEKFLTQAKQNHLYELKGHRSIGGCRASLYNACPMDSAKELAQFMETFATKNSS